MAGQAALADRRIWEDRGIDASFLPTVHRPTDPREKDISYRVLRHWHEGVPNDRMAHLVKDATRGFMRALQVRLAEHDVSLGHWTFLRILWAQDGLTQRELSAEAGVMEPTTVTALRAMEALGYVARERRGGNRKNVHVVLTPLGRRLKDVLVPLAEEVNAVALHGLDDAEVAVTRRALLSMIDNLAQDGGSGPERPAAAQRTVDGGPKPLRPG